jgi:hypothetical protein
VKARVAALATAVLTAAGMLGAFTPGPAVAQQSFPGSAVFSAYANGTKQHVRLVQAGSIDPQTGTTLANVDTSFSGATASSAGLGTKVNNVFGETVQPAQSGKNSYARGASAEVALGADFPSDLDPSQIILPSLLEAAAAPSTSLLVKNLAEIPADPLLFLDVAQDKAQALWNPNFCVLGQPMSYGANNIAHADILNAGDTPFPSDAAQPVVSTHSVNGNDADTDANFNESYTYLFPNGDGTFGVGSVNRQVLAPLVIGRGLAPAIGGVPQDLVDITILGTWHLRVEDSGKGGPPTVDYGAIGPDGKDPVIQVKLAGTEVLPTPGLSLQDILGAGGLTIPDNPILDGSIGAPPTPIPGRTNAFQVNVIDLHLLSFVPNAPLNVADIDYGHMEAQAQTPSGGLDCPLPVSKTIQDANGATTSELTGGSPFTWKVVFPSADISKELACDLTKITVTDTADIPADGGSASAKITSASNGGKIVSDTVAKGKNGVVTWSLPDYHPGDPPVTLTIGATLGPNAGKIHNLVTVDATLGNCKGGAAGQAFVNNAAVGGRAAKINGSAVSGVGSVTANLKPAVAPARLSETGLSQPWLPVAGGGLLLGALALIRSRRKLYAERA